MPHEPEIKANALAILKTIFDPEIPVNLVDLGLIYHLALIENVLHIQMTLTNPECPVANQFPAAVKSHLINLPGIKEVIVELVRDPAWTPDKMTEAAKY